MLDFTNDRLFDDIALHIHSKIDERFKEESLKAERRWENACVKSGVDHRRIINPHHNAMRGAWIGGNGRPEFTFNSVRNVVCNVFGIDEVEYSGSVGNCIMFVASVYRPHLENKATMFFLEREMEEVMDYVRPVTHSVAFTFVPSDKTIEEIHSFRGRVHSFYEKALYDILGFVTNKNQ